MLKPYIAKLFGRAYLKSTTGEIALKGFRATGIYPFNPQVFTEVDYLTEESNNNQLSSTPDNQDAGPVANQSAPEESVEAQAPEHSLVLPENIQPISTTKTRTSNRVRKATTAKHRIVNMNEEEAVDADEDVDTMSNVITTEKGPVGMSFDAREKLHPAVALKVTKTQ
ncbi:uncharacterized protein LOC132701156 [Cylas formicarius]|uniref:uncharacterized protein LOC132701156 n=1 Tax=Cylas formicarius TaxID=197179 RepID=UPI002958AD2F|nr:uncharacterized protein LOC132701156 [Cylas formicarius]